MNAILADLTLAFRLLRKSPGFALTVIAVLSLGVGANTAIFSVIHGVLLHPFPYEDPDRIVFIGAAQEGNSLPVAYPDYLDWADQAHTFDHVGWATGRTMVLSGGLEPASVNAALVSSSIWNLLGLPPLQGRTFTGDEDRPGAPPVAVISAALWQGRLGGDPAILGRVLRLDDRSYTVVGVMPARFKFWAGDLWLPAGLEADSEVMRSRVLRINSWGLGKLKAGVTMKEAEAELNVIAQRIAAQHPETSAGLGATVRLLSESVNGPVREPLIILLAAVACVLLIACANVANLLLARAATRQREFAVRAALGSGRLRLVQQVLLEVMPLVLLGGLGGILAGAWGLQALLALLPPEAIPAEAVVEVNLPVMAVSLGVCVSLMALFSLLPAFQLARTQFIGVLQAGSRGSDGPTGVRVRSALIVAELTLSLILLVGAGLLIRSFGQLQAVDPGFRAENLLAVSIQLPETRYPQGHRATQFYQEVVERVRRLPGVVAVAAASNAPFLGGSGIPLLTPGRTYSSLNDLESVQFATVWGEYFAAQGLRLVRGRTFTEMDRAGSEPVIILNEAAVQRFLPPGADPLGQQVMLGLPANLFTPDLLPPGLADFQWSRVVGVVESARHFGLQHEPTPAAYLPVEQSWNVPLMRNNQYILIRTAGEPTSVVAGARAAVAAVDPHQPVGQVTTMEQTIHDSLRSSRFTTVLLGLFAAVAAILAVIGIYGVIAWTVAQRTRELGIRAALGASRPDVVRLVLAQGLRLVVWGTVLGIAGALALSRVLQRLLYQTSALDPWTFIGVSVLLGGVALAACVLPALRASRISPLEALRSE